MSTNTTPTLFSAVPNTSDYIEKTVSHLTVIETSRAGYEARDAVRAVPRLTYKAGYLLGPDDWAALRATDTFLLPAHMTLPAGVYELEDPEHQIEHVKYGALARASILWRALENDETVPAYDGPRSEHKGLFLFPSDLVDGSEQPVDETTWSVNEFDEGNLWSRSLRHKKRTVSVLVYMSGQEELDRFYRFMHHLRGRYRAFRYQHFVDDVERTWRLASDSFTLKFYNATRAHCLIRMTHLEHE